MLRGWGHCCEQRKDPVFSELRIVCVCARARARPAGHSARQRMQAGCWLVHSGLFGWRDTELVGGFWAWWAAPSPEPGSWARLQGSSLCFLSQSLHGCETGDCGDADPCPQRLYEGNAGPPWPLGAPGYCGIGGRRQEPPSARLWESGLVFLAPMGPSSVLIGLASREKKDVFSGFWR